MLKRLWKPCAYRNFSRSSLWRNELKKPPESSSNSQRALQLDGIPKEWEKRILVLSGRYKSYEEIPPRVSMDTIGKAKSIMRIRTANVMIVVVLILCFYYSYKAKQMARGGDSITKRILERNEKVKAEGRADDEAKAKAQSEAQGH